MKKKKMQNPINKIKQNQDEEEEKNNEEKNNGWSYPQILGSTLHKKVYSNEWRVSERVSLVLKQI